MQNKFQISNKKERRQSSSHPVFEFLCVLICIGFLVVPIEVIHIVIWKILHCLLHGLE
jgi:hypothetical protein